MISTHTHTNRIILLGEDHVSLLARNVGVDLEKMASENRIVFMDEGLEQANGYHVPLDDEHIKLITMLFEGVKFLRTASSTDDCVQRRMNQQKTEIINYGIRRVKLIIVFFFDLYKFAASNTLELKHALDEKLVKSIFPKIQNGMLMLSQFPIDKNLPATPVNLQKFTILTDCLFGQKNELIDFSFSLVPVLSTRISANHPNVTEYLNEIPHILAGVMATSYFTLGLRNVVMAENIVSCYKSHDCDIIVKAGAGHVIDEEYKSIGTILKENYPHLNAPITTYLMIEDFNLEQALNGH